VTNKEKFLLLVSDEKTNTLEKIKLRVLSRSIKTTMSQRTTVSILSSKKPELLKIANDQNMLLSTYLEYAGAQLPVLKDFLTRFLQDNSPEKMQQLRNEGLELLRK
jgi:hypothetical protein